MDDGEDKDALGEEDFTGIYIMPPNSLGTVTEAIPSGCSMSFKLVGRLRTGERFRVIKTTYSSVGAQGVSKLYGRVDKGWLGDEVRNIEGWVDLTSGSNPPEKVPEKPAKAIKPSAGYGGASDHTHRSPTMDPCTCSTEPWGTVAASSSPAFLYTLTNGNGMSISVTNRGGALTSVRIPSSVPAAADAGAAAATHADVILGYDTLDQYIAGKANFGTLVGRCANRIAGATFTLPADESVGEDAAGEGGAGAGAEAGGAEAGGAAATAAATAAAAAAAAVTTVTLTANNGPNALHGGPGGLYSRLFEGEASVSEDGGTASVLLRYTSPDGEEGYPGTLQLECTYVHPSYYTCQVLHHIIQGYPLYTLCTPVLSYIHLTHLYTPPYTPYTRHLYALIHTPPLLLVGTRSTRRTSCASR
jgi:hypothetical protein